MIPECLAMNNELRKVEKQSKNSHALVPRWNREGICKKKKMIRFWQNEFKNHSDVIIGEIKNQLSQGSVNYNGIVLPNACGVIEPLISGRFSRIRAILVSAINWRENWDIGSGSLKAQVIRDILLSKDF